MSIPGSLLVGHFIGDFLLQSDWMAINKSKRIEALLLHVAVYSLCFVWLGLAFVAATIVTHFAVDFVTSRVNAKLWAANQRHWFFVCIGFDQLLHYTTLAWTYRLLI